MPDMPRQCMYCEKSVLLISADSESNKVLCRKKGVVNGEGVCRRFVYDPLKRVPAPTPKFNRLSGSDLLL